MPFPPPARCLRQSFYAPIKSEHHRVLTDLQEVEKMSYFEKQTTEVGKAQVAEA